MSADNGLLIRKEGKKYRLYEWYENTGNYKDGFLCEHKDLEKLCSEAEKIMGEDPYGYEYGIFFKLK